MNRVQALAGLCLLGALAGAHAQTTGQYVWEEFDKRINASEKVAPLGANFAGDQVSLKNGALSFSATDVSLPGSNALKVEFSRTYTVFNRRDYAFSGLGMLADWLVDVPSISAVFAPNWEVGASGAEGRCSSGTIPITQAVAPFTVNDFWQGLQLNLPGGGGGELMRTAVGVQKPTDGPTYQWMTNQQVHLSCLSTIKNGSGEGFLARTPDGTRYWFDWMGQTPEPKTIQKRIVGGVPIYSSIERKKNFLYVTRVEDRFGNSVSYTYSNAWNAPGRLTNIQGSDGRALTISYIGNTISSVSDGSRTWTYSYGSTPAGRTSLTAVGLPDGSAWTIGLTAVTDAVITPWESPERTCFYEDEPKNWDAKFVGKLVHPAGATAEFTLGIQQHGNGWVPISCRNVSTTLTGTNKGADNVQADDINMWPTSAYALTLEKKSISGPGLTQADWLYAYVPNNSVYAYPGTTSLWPVCDWANVNCRLPPCTNDGCASASVTTVTGPNNEWRRYYHGNTYRYNDGKLLREEAGSGPTDILRKQESRYDLSQLDKVYPARLGVSQRLDGDGFSSEYHRPLLKSILTQQGRQFTREVTAFDALARPTQQTRSSAPEGVTALSAFAASSSTTDGSLPQGAAPESPRINEASVNDAGDVRLVWAPVPGAARYVVQGLGARVRFTQMVDGTQSELALRLPSKVKLRLRLQACSADGACSAFAEADPVKAKSADVGLGR